MKRVFVFVLFIGVVISASLTIRYDEYLKDNPALGEWSYDCHSPADRHSTLIHLDDQRCIFSGATMCQRVSYDVVGDTIRVIGRNGTLIEEVVVLEGYESPNIDNGTTGMIMVVVPSGGGLVDGKALTDVGEQTVYQSCRSSVNNLFLWEITCLTGPSQHCPES